MTDFSEQSFDELTTADPFDLSENELKSLVIALARKRRDMLVDVVPSVSQLDKRLELAQHELSSRSATKLAKLSIGISLLAILIAAAGIIL